MADGNTERHTVHRASLTVRIGDYPDYAARSTLGMNQMLFQSMATTSKWSLSLVMHELPSNCIYTYFSLSSAHRLISVFRIYFSFKMV